MSDPRTINLSFVGRFKNHYLVNAVDALGSQAALAEALGVSMNVLSRWILLKNSPRKEWQRENEALIVKTLGALPEDVWPDSLKSVRATISRKVKRCVTVTEDQFLSLNTSPSLSTKNLMIEEPIDAFALRKAIKDALEQITPREEKVIRRKYYDNMTYKEIAEEFELPSERIRQIELRAISKLRRPKRCRSLQEFVYE